MIETLVSDMRAFAKTNFPVITVSSYLQKLNLNDEGLRKFSFFEEKFYTRNLIHREKDFEIMVICWPPNTCAPIHGHEGEKCWARVENGRLQICNYEELSSNPLELKMITKISCEPGFLDGPADIHSVANLTNKYAVSLHVYAKPYDACDIYNIEEKKIIRTQLGYHSIDGNIC
tara:strand:+ start:217 stop:738 length:522 start_codon:yes stop_codon:yes gene_type:complete